MGINDELALVSPDGGDGRVCLYFCRVAVVGGGGVGLTYFSLVAPSVRYP